MSAVRLIARASRRPATSLLSSVGLSLLAGVALFGTTAEEAAAACVLTGGSAHLCSASNTTPQAVTDDNAAVTTAPGFGIDTSGTPALSITGNGALSYIDANSSSIRTTASPGTAISIIATGDDGGTPGSVTISTGGTITGEVSTSNQGTGATSITTTGSVTGTAHSSNVGIRAVNGLTATDITINAAAVDGANFGIYAENNGVGETSVIATGTVTATGGTGISATNNGVASTNLSVQAVDVGGSFAGIAAFNSGTGTTSVTATGTVTGIVGEGISVVAGGLTATDITVNAVDVSGGTKGVSVDNFGAGGIAITTTGQVTATSDTGIGIQATNEAIFGATTGITINADDVTAGLTGIDVSNGGNGATSITATGLVSATAQSASVGIHAVNGTTATDLVVNADDVDGSNFGIWAENSGTGLTSVTATGTVTATNGTAINVSGYNPTSTDVTVNAVDATGSYGGISAFNGGTGTTSVIATGTVTGTTGQGIYVLAGGLASSDVAVNANDVNGGSEGVYVQNFGAGSTTITTTGLVTATASSASVGIRAVNELLGSTTDLTVNANAVAGSNFGIWAENNGTGFTSVSATGRVTATDGSGINVSGYTLGTDVSVEAVDVSGLTGIYAYNGGTGTLGVTATGTVTGTTYQGIMALAGGLSTSDITVEAHNVTGATEGVYAGNFGIGAIDITTTGRVVATADTGIGIRAVNEAIFDATTDVTVNANEVSAGLTGIDVENNGHGFTLITATGLVSATSQSASVGIHADNAATTTDLTVEAASVTGANFGIWADNAGTGSTSVSATGRVTATGGTGITVSGYAGTDVSVEAADVSGSVVGINAFNGGTGTLDVVSTGTVRGDQLQGINVLAGGLSTSDVTVDARNVHGGTTGIEVLNAGIGTTAITARGAVEGGTAGIAVTALTGTATTIDVVGIGAEVRNSSRNPSDLAISITGGTAAIDNQARITGLVLLADEADTFDNSGVWRTVAGINQFGGGDDLLTNLAGGRIVTARSAGIAELTEFAGLETFENAGWIVLRDGGVGDRASFGGDYVTDGGLLALDAQLGGGAPSDVLHVAGDAILGAGATRLYVANPDMSGRRTVGDGILVVEVDGTSSPDAFALGAPVKGGLWNYGLFFGGVVDPSDQDWYLRSTDLRTEVLPALMLTAAAREMGMSFLGTRSTRLGLPQGAEGGEGFGRGGWVRVIGRTGESTADTSLGDLDFDAQTAGIEAGIDLYRTSADDGSGDQAGVYAGYASGWGDVGGLDGGSRSGSYTLRGTSLGAYWTHVGAGGWYVDAVVQGTWYTARTSSPEDIGASTDGFGWLASLEGGYPIALDEHQSIVPQLQLVYGATRFDDTDDGYATFEFDDGTSLLGRAGLRWQRTDDIDLGEGVTLVTPYIEASLWHAFEGDGTVAIGGEDVDVATSETWATIGLGGTAELAPGAALFGDVAYEVSVDGVERQGVSGRAGLRLTW